MNFKTSDMGLGDWIVILGGIGCLFSIFLGIGIYVLDEQPARIRWEKIESDSQRDLNFSDYGFTRMFRIVATLVVWVGGAIVSGIGSVISPRRRSVYKKVRKWVWLVNGASLGLALLMMLL